MQEMPEHGGLCLELPDGSAPVRSITDANQALRPFGARIWRLDLSNEPADVAAIRLDKRPTNDELDRLRDRHLLPRERLVEIFESAGRTLQVPGGGSLSTVDTTHNITYPQLYLAEEGIDYSRFDRLHINVTDDGTGVDELMVMLSGRGVLIRQMISEGSTLDLHLDCPDEMTGWRVTYDGTYPHVGSLSGAELGTKILMQVVGAERWSMKYSGF